jgi:hypothetical protein
MQKQQCKDINMVESKKLRAVLVYLRSNTHTQYKPPLIFTLLVCIIFWMVIVLWQVWNGYSIVKLNQRRTEGVKTSEIYGQVIVQYGHNFMNQKRVNKWPERFKWYEVSAIDMHSG